MTFWTASIGPLFTGVDVFREWILHLGGDTKRPTRLLPKPRLKTCLQPGNKTKKNTTAVNLVKGHAEVINQNHSGSSGFTHRAVRTSREISGKLRLNQGMKIAMIWRGVVGNQKYGVARFHRSTYASKWCLCVNSVSVNSIYDPVYLETSVNWVLKDQREAGYER